MKRFMSCVLPVLCLVFLAGCGSGGDIAGIWEQEMEISILGVSGSDSAPSVVRFIFLEEGTGTQAQIISDEKYPDAERAFSYSLEGETLVLEYENGQKTVFTVSMDGDSLVLENPRGSFQLKKIRE